MSRYLSRLKGLLPDDPDRSWRSWAVQKLQRNPCPSNEFLTLFPGWAARRYHHPNSDTEPPPFDIEVSVSGYASSCRANGQITRSQRAFLRIAKGFAALPRISDQPTTPEEPSNDDLRALEQQFRSTATSTDDPDVETPASSFLTVPPRQINTPLDVLQKLHCNLESRIQLFWSSCLSARTVRLHLFVSPRDSLSPDAQHRHAEDDAHRPIASVDVVTAVDGSFNARFCILWQELCRHHRGVYIAYGLPAEEHDLVIVAELLPPPVFNASVSTPNISLQSTAKPLLKPSFSSHAHTSSQSNIYLDVPANSRSQSQSHPHLNTLLNSLSKSISSSFSSSVSALHSTLMPSSTSLTHTTLPLTHSPIRVISDIDDTVKMSGITEGARAVFHNVFVKELKDGVIPGMGEWYTNMWERGVRFHYVSNGPFEYLPLLHEFFALSKLPPGSIKLKSYAGRSLLSGLLSAPAARKRAGVVEILDSFPDSKFILIGDSGEQDLELYADLARDRPDQIIAVFIRDADESNYVPIRDPTGWEMVGAGKFGTRPDTGSLLDYDYTSPPISEAPSPRLEFPEPTRNPGDKGQQQQQITPRAKVQRRFSGKSDNMHRFTTPFRKDIQGFEEDSVNTLETPTQKGVPLFESPTITPSNSVFLGPPKPMATAPDIITTPPSPIHPLRLPSSLSSSSPTPLPSRLTNSPQQDSIDRPRAIKATSDPPPQITITTNGRVNDDQFERPGISTVTRTTHRNNTIGPTPSPSSSSSNPLSYIKPYSRLSFHGFGVGNWNGNDGHRRVVSGTSIASITNNGRDHGGRSNNGSASSIGESSISSSSTSSSPVNGGISGSGTHFGTKSESEKKRGELQMRVCTARTQMPSGVSLRVFRSPDECREDVERILEGEVGV